MYGLYGTRSVPSVATPVTGVACSPGRHSRCIRNQPCRLWPVHPRSLTSCRKAASTSPAAAAAAAAAPAEDASSLLASAAVPRSADNVADSSTAAAAASTSGRSTTTAAAASSQPSQPQHQQQQQQQRHDPLKSLFGAVTSSWKQGAAGDRPVEVLAEPLPLKNYGVLQGGQYPFLYDPVYGLPIVREVARYGEVLRDIRQGEVDQICWYFDPAKADPYFLEGRCLVRYKDGRVKQSVVPPEDARIPYAMQAHGVESVKLPLEPRHVPEFAVFDDQEKHPVNRMLRQHFAYQEYDGWGPRRGPRVGPSPEEEMLLKTQDDIAELVTINQAVTATIAEQLHRMPTEDWEAYQGASRGGSKEISGADWEKNLQKAAPKAEPKGSWSDRITISQDTQALIYKYVPIVGPILGSAFVVGLYVLARLLRGDLTDRMKMMDEAEEKRRRTALKEARIAFLEEEVPTLVARRVPLEDIRRKMVEINKKLGEKFEISDTELVSTVDACSQLITQGADLDIGSSSTQAAERILAEEAAAAQASAQAQVASEGGGGEPSAESALAEMGKLNTARIRKAVDPKIMDVKKRVRAARRSMKRDSKVQLTDEIIFFDDVAGNEQAKVELMEVVDFFRRPEKYRSSGARAPKGVLLVGPPGNGKTLMARAVAGESGVAFISSSASEFIEMYMGLGAARVRDLFNTARKLAPCIIFIDELDAVGRARRSGSQGGNEERDNTVNQLLTELDGFSAETTGIVVMGATNRKDVLDQALTRPGRFDRSIEVRRPDFVGRLEGIKVHLRDKPIADDIDYASLAALTGGMSGAQLAGVCNTACFLASRQGRTEVTQVDLVAATEQMKYGKTYEALRFISPARRRRFAIMEAGISLVATLMPAIEEVDYVTIVPSQQSPIGRTVLKPNIGRYSTGLWTKRYLQEQLLVSLAGRAAEEVLLGRDELSSLNQHRIMMARQIVHKMLNAGFSEHPDYQHIRTLGSWQYDESFEPGRTTTFVVSTDWNQTRTEWIDVDIEMENLLNDGYAKVKALIERNRPCMEALVEALLTNDRVAGEEVRGLVERLAAPQDLEVRAVARDAVLL